MGNYDDPELAGRPARRRWPVVLGIVLALLAGGAAGYAGRALTAEPPPPVVVTAPPAAAPPAPASPSAACTAAAEAGSALAEQLRLAATAIRDLDPGALRAVLDRVQRLQGELEAAARACSTVVSPQARPGPPPR